MVNQKLVIPYRICTLLFYDCIFNAYIFQFNILLEKKPISDTQF